MSDRSDRLQQSNITIVIYESLQLTSRPILYILLSKEPNMLPESLFINEKFYATAENKAKIVCI